jgi:AraC-like DNA-binding protein
MKALLQNYRARMQRVLDYIDRHLDGDLDLETVSRVAAFSKFHFHRQFTATFGLTASAQNTRWSTSPTRSSNAVTWSSWATSTSSVETPVPSLAFAVASFSDV